MNVVGHLFLVTALMATALQGNAKNLPSQCLRREIEAHVLQQFGTYGPLSVNREYFGFIYLHDGAIGSAVTRSRVCAKSGNCWVDSSEAVRSIPQSAKVLGEWHTHPHHGSGSLSADDVRGAYNNRHISCYSAFYSTPSGAIYAWNANQISVPIAMASRAHIGNYTDSALALAGRNPALDGSDRLVQPRRRLRLWVRRAQSEIVTFSGVPDKGCIGSDSCNCRPS